MAQITNGLRSILSSPIVYATFQNLVGANRARKSICTEYLRALPGHVVVDVGCGPAEILEHLNVGVRYYGFDLSPPYIDAAKATYGNRGQFFCADITAPDLEVPPCDIALAIGLLHHLDDVGATQLITHLYSRLIPGGRLITVDPAYWPNQSPIARLIISKDRGQNVREGEAYRALAVPAFSNVKVIRRDDLLNIPYSHAILECTK